MTPVQEQLVLDHMHLVRRLARKVKGRWLRLDRDDLTSEGYLALCKCAISFQNKSKFTTYMYKSVLLAMYGSISDKADDDVKRMQFFSVDALLNNPGPANSELGRLSKMLTEKTSVSQSPILANATRERFKEVIPLLRDDYQYIIKRKILDEATDRQVGDEMTLTPTAVRKRLIKALEVLRLMFEGQEVQQPKQNKRRRRTKALKKAELVYCACKCGTLIPEKGPNGSKRKYATGHQHKNFDPSQITGKASTQTVVDGKKLCSKCGEMKTLEEFAKESHKPSGRAAACKICKSSRSKELANQKKAAQRAEYERKLDKFY